MLATLRPDSPARGTARSTRATSLHLLCLVVLLVVLALAAVASLRFGHRSTSFADVWVALHGHQETIEQIAAGSRVPRTILGVAVGAALAVSGTTFQAVTRNPLADPGIFGVLSGASLFVVISIVGDWSQAPLSRMIYAMLGAAAAAAFVYTVGSLGRGGATPLKLALAGAATSAAVSSLVGALILPNARAMDDFRFWQIGSIGRADWTTMRLGIPLLIVGFLVCWLCATRLNSLAMGDDVATSLGVSVPWTRGIASIGAVILCGVATALAGPIAFVGLIVPHILRLIVGSDHRWLMPLSALAGAALLVLSDVAGRVFSSSEDLSVGIITPLIGAPLFIVIVRRSRMRDTA